MKKSNRKRLMKLSQYREEYFVTGSAPAASTLRRMIEDGELPGERIGKVYYVNVSNLGTGNHLVDMVLQAS
jgi:hypothetical protein